MRLTSNVKLFSLSLRTRFSQCGAVFDDGTEFACDAIVACTGYRNAFPLFLDPAHADEPVAGACGGITYKDLARELTNPRLLYKQCLHPAFPDGSLAVMGFARPAFGSIPPCSEMQVRATRPKLSVAWCS